jgi:hypothetical protein
LFHWRGCRFLVMIHAVACWCKCYNSSAPTLCSFILLPLRLQWCVGKPPSPYLQCLTCVQWWTQSGVFPVCLFVFFLVLLLLYTHRHRSVTHSQALSLSLSLYLSLSTSHLPPTPPPPQPLSQLIEWEMWGRKKSRIADSGVCVGGGGGEGDALWV